MYSYLKIQTILTKVIKSKHSKSIISYKKSGEKSVSFLLRFMKYMIALV